MKNWLSSFFSGANFAVGLIAIGLGWLFAVTLEWVVNNILYAMVGALIIFSLGHIVNKFISGLAEEE